MTIVTRPGSAASRSRTSKTSAERKRLRTLKLGRDRVAETKRAQYIAESIQLRPPSPVQLGDERETLTGSLELTEWPFAIWFLGAVSSAGGAGLMIYLGTHHGRDFSNHTAHWWQWGIGIVLQFFALGFFLMGQKVSLVLDATQGTMEIHTATFCKRSTVSHRLNEISEVSSARHGTYSAGEGSDNRQYAVAFTLHDGNMLHSISSSDRATVKGWVCAVQRYLLSYDPNHGAEEAVMEEGVGAGDCEEGDGHDEYDVGEEDSGSGCGADMGMVSIAMEPESDAAHP